MKRPNQAPHPSPPPRRGREKTLRSDARVLVETCPGALSRLVARRITQFLDRELAPTGISSAQMALMAQIAAADDDTLGGLAERSGLEQSTLSRNLRTLENAGLIEKRVDRQFRVVHARPEALRPVGSWFERQQRHWSDAFDRLEAAIAAETPKRRKS